MTNPHAQSAAPWHGTTILSARSDDKVVIIGDGQVSMGQTVMKPNARKVRRLHDGSVIGGFAGATADVFTLFERLEAQHARHYVKFLIHAEHHGVRCQPVMNPTSRNVRGLHDGIVTGGFAGSTADVFTPVELLEATLERHNGQWLRAAVELAKDWRTDKDLRKLEAMMIVADKEVTLVITGNGDVLEPLGGIAEIGSGGNLALSAARALADRKRVARGKRG